MLFLGGGRQTSAGTGNRGSAAKNRTASGAERLKKRLRIEIKVCLILKTISHTAKLADVSPALASALCDVTNVHLSMEM